MDQFPYIEPPIWSVSELTRYIRALLEADPYLQGVWVTGEVSNVSRPGSGHLYFTLKDRNASVRCVMWRSTVARQAVQIRDGDAIEVFGSISVYDVGGNYQLYAQIIRPAGEGILYQEFMRLKASLEAEGLFESARKKTIPAWPHRLGIVTSPTAAALRDILNTIRRRYPLIEVILSPTTVQGTEAPIGIVNALQALGKLVPLPDVVLVARGGGSIEDLWAFNDERVARAVAAAPFPIISGVGHETDFTIIDFVADLRAPTPTAAAELATPDGEELMVSLAEEKSKLAKFIQSTLELHRNSLGNLVSYLQRSSPMVLVRVQRQRLDESLRRLQIQAKHSLQLRQMRLETQVNKLHALSPEAVLQRGFAVVRNQRGSIIRSVSQVSRGDKLQIRVSDGEFSAEVEGPDREPGKGLNNEQTTR
jgi:exodeoxyribonuclease VII large subunit